jgi:hypothetical protein
MNHLAGLIVLCLICGGIAALIGQKKNLPVKDSFLYGAFLGIIGIIIVICQKPGLPQAPPGMRAVKCRRCNTAQNVPESQRVYECWQCKASNELWAAPPAVETTQTAPAVQTIKVKCHACQYVQRVPVVERKWQCGGCGIWLQRRTA